MTHQIRVTLEIGPKGKKVVAVAPDWPGLERGAKNGEKALGYCWSVALVEEFEEGRKEFENLFELRNKNILWILKENLKKNRLIKLDKNWVEEKIRQLG